MCGADPSTAHSLRCAFLVGSRGLGRAFHQLSVSGYSGRSDAGRARDAHGRSRLTAHCAVSPASRRHPTACCRRVSGRGTSSPVPLSRCLITTHDS